MVDPGIRILTKSRYLSGVQCDKRLWIESLDPTSVPAPDAATLARFEEGRRVGELARALFPGGTELTVGPPGWDRWIADTDRALRDRRPLYEAAFRHRQAACRVDLLVPENDDTWSVYEVKSSTGVKDIHLEDLAFQAWVLEGSGLPVRDYWIVFLNRAYERSGELDVEALFSRQPVSDQVRSRRAEVEEGLARCERVLERSNCPEVAIGPHCLTPYPCPLKPLCWSSLPPASVVDLTRDRQKGFELLAAGWTQLREIPDTLDLERRQRIQLAAVRSGRPHVDAPALAAFLAQLEYPIHYFDIESFAPAVPPFDRSRPYQQIPFLFSVHRVDRPGGEARHFAHIVDGDPDPRAEFLRAASSALGERGSIVAYNAPFEVRVLSETARDVEPLLTDRIAALQRRFIDLLTPFRDFSYHHPDQMGSASLKSVLEPLTGLTYAGLGIADGETAGREFLRLKTEELPYDQRRRVLEQLVEYCSLDTLGMVAIVERLETLVSRGSQANDLETSGDRPRDSAPVRSERLDENG